MFDRLFYKTYTVTVLSINAEKARKLMKQFHLTPLRNIIMSDGDCENELTMINACGHIRDIMKYKKYVNQSEFTYADH